MSSGPALQPEPEPAGATDDDSRASQVKHLWSTLASIKRRYRPTYDGLKPAMCDFDTGDGQNDDCRWWGEFEVDLRDPKLKRLPVLRCECSRSGI